MATRETHEPTAEVPARAPAGVFARLGAWSGSHLRAVLLIWLVLLAGFGVFAPRVTSALAGAGWQDSTSQSVQARQVIEKDFSGLGSSALQVVIVDHARQISADPAAQAVVTRVEATLRASKDVSTVVPPAPGLSVSRDGRTAVVTGGAAAGTNQMVAAAEALAGPLASLGTAQVTVTLTGDSALWADFNTANHSAMMRSEMLSWPVTLAILVIAFGSLVAAGLPLMLTMAGLLVAAGALVLANAVAPVSIWALNFALMFSLALGIDYALFLVVRFRAALERQGDRPGDRAAAVAAAAETVATAGKAVAFSAATVLASLASILIVPSPAFRSMALGIMLSVVALGAPLVAFAGVVVTGLSVAGAFGVARLIFQDGYLSGLLNFSPQGFIDAWGPLFFGAMVFGVAMDYTLFLLTAAKERYETHADPERSLVGSVRTSGRVVVSAAAVMIAVFLTFALSGPLAPKEMGVILAVAVALDALVVRLVLIPALLAVAGHAAWHQPRWLSRILPKVRFAH
jgi:uncharacterized membrane protein YdfJ with MMPL/SSD domain